MGQSTTITFWIGVIENFLYNILFHYKSDF